jgi:hypothetical protein
MSGTRFPAPGSIEERPGLLHVKDARCHEICFMHGGFGEADKIPGLRHAHTALQAVAVDGGLLP